MKATKDINFLPDYVLQRQLASKRNAEVIIWILTSIFLAVGLYFTPMQVYKYYKAENEQYKEKLSKLSYVQQKVDELQEIRSNKDKKKTVIAKINSKQVRMVENIDKINNCMPPNVQLKSCSVSGKEINTSFVVNSPLEVIDLLDRLESVNAYKKVSLGSSPVVDENATINIKLDLK